MGSHHNTGIHSGNTLPLQTHLHGNYRPSKYLKHAYTPTKHAHAHKHILLSLHTDTGNIPLT
ncbi:hypothetical protein K457DRAFT_142903 [Linnemannia elongata AG-77]|uniref:Uncharacterized protein n=1 Tax=Linnemannia elongata AG-77 TaxID=1314771 RepID=A0A197JFD6_9FUNG|nr:hypothetical protein K457DRAFT_142903 [Linnemannia elongata AG-77]